MKGDFARLRQFERELRDLAAPEGRAQRSINIGAASAVHGLIKDEFSTGAGPYGAWKEKKRGGAALVSRKIPQNFFVIAIPGGVYAFSRVPWLEAHHEGHVFAKRDVAGNKQYLSFNAKGKLVSESRIFKRGIGPAREGEQFRTLRRGAYQTYARAHSVGERVLAQRKIYPDQGTMPDKWGSKINAAADDRLRKWGEKAVG